MVKFVTAMLTNMFNYREHKPVNTDRMFTLLSGLFLGEVNSVSSPGQARTARSNKSQPEPGDVALDAPARHDKSQTVYYALLYF